MLRARVVGAVLLTVVGTMAAAGPASASDGDKGSLVDRIVASADPALMEVLVTSKSSSGRPQFHTIKVPDVAAAKRVVHDMLGKPGVSSVEMNHRVTAQSVSDPYFSRQWALNYSHLYFNRIYQLTRYDSRRRYVAVVDSGIQANHPDLASRMLSGYEFHEQSAGLLSGTELVGSATASDASNDDCGHGTHVAGIIGARLNNGIGVVGLAQRAAIRSVKVLGSDCSGSDATVAAGITWAADHANVINLSLGSPDASDAERQAVSYALNKGRVVVAAAGNHDSSLDNVPSYPAAYSGVIGVAAVDIDGRRADFSNTGSYVDVAAPGVGIVSTYPTNTYAYEDGTSMASPFVAAEAVMAMQHCGYSAARTRYKIQSTASSFPSKYSTIGYGIIRPVKLLTCR